MSAGSAPPGHPAASPLETLLGRISTTTGPPIAFGLAGAHALLALYDLLLVAAPLGATLATTSALVAVGCAWVGAILRRHAPPEGALHLPAGALAWLVLANAAAHLLVLADLLQAAWLAVLIGFTAYLFLSLRALGLWLAAVAALWLAARTSFADPGEWIAAGLLLGMSGGLAVLRLRVRLRLFPQLAERIASYERREAALEDAQAHSRALLEAVPDMILRIRRDGTYLAFAEATDVRPALAPESIVGSRVHDVLDPERADRALEIFDEVLRTGQVRSLEYSLDEDGEKQYYEARIAPASGDDVVTVVRNITDRRRADAERERLQEQLLQAQKLEGLGLLAGGIAHDFNNLLAAILGNASIAAAEAPPGSAAREALGDVLEAGERARALTGQLLAYAGRGASHREPLDLSGEVGAIAKLLEASVPKRVRFELALATGLPSVEADPAQIQQIVMNLVLNAAEATASVGGCVRVTTGEAEFSAEDARTLEPGAQRPAGRYVVLEVEDDGTGMDEATRARIFDPFFSTRRPGRGLGLSAVLGLVRTLGGGISVETTPNVGTRFTVLLPASERAAQARRAAAAVRGRGSGRVLLVDDDAAVRRMARRCLERLGFDVTETSDGTTALARFAEAPGSFRLAVVDLTMPGLDGEETLRALRRVRPELPVVLSSGFDGSEVTARVAPEERVAFLHKPYRPEELAARLAEIGALAPADAPAPHERGGGAATPREASPSRSSRPDSDPSR